MSFRKFFPALALLLAAAPAFAGGDAPSAETFKFELNAHMQKIRGDAWTRTVLFQDVTPGKPNGQTYPFLVNAIVHDYNPGFPPNKFYGFTRVGKMEGYKFVMFRDEFNKWVVQGRMTPDFDQKQNPSEGVSAVPVSSLPGTPAGKALADSGKQPTPAGSKLYVGEYASYGTGGRLLVGLGFVLKEGGMYHDLDGQRGGRYAYDATAATITFQGGFMDGQVGRAVTVTGFQLSPTIRCEPWRK